MKINCEIVQDLLPLYEDGVCSESSRAAVEEHLKTCDNCRKMKEGAAAIPETEVLLESSEQDEAAADSFKKVRRRWRASLLAVLLVMPLLVLCFNEIRGRGPGLTNLDDIYAAQKYVKHLEKGEYEQAAKMHDFTDEYDYLLGLLKNTAVDYRQDFRQVMAGEEVWFVSGIAVSDKEDPSDFWLRFLFNDYVGVLFPEEVMVWLWENQPDVLTKINKDCYQNSNGIRFIRNNTPWGEYFTAENFVINIDTVTVVPEEAYLQILPEIEEKAQSIFRKNQEQFGPVAQMTEKDFIAYMEEKYVSKLKEAFEEHYTIEYIGLSYAGRDRSFAIGELEVDDDCQVQIKVHITAGTNEADVDLILCADGGKVVFGGMRYWEAGSQKWLDELWEYLYAGYAN